MFQIAPGTSTEGLYQRILTLDRSDEDFSVQITEALDILGIEPHTLSIQYQHNHRDLKLRRNIASKDEWFLRWLLKRLNADSIQNRSPCLDSRAWQLLGLLINHLTTTVTARLLGTIKFITTLERTLQWLSVHIQSLPISHEDRIALPSSEKSEDSGSSTTLEVAPSFHPKRSRKRKRDGAESFVDRPYVATLVQATELFLAICGTLQHIILRTEMERDDPSHFNAEHMKAVMRCPPELAGMMLGSSLTIAKYAWKPFQQDSRFRDLNIYDSLVSPCTAMWDLRSTGSKNSIGVSSIQAFSAHSLVPALQLVISSQGLSGVGRESAVKNIEILIATYTVLPIRSAPYPQKTSRDFRSIDQEGDEDTGKILLRPLAQRIVAEFKGNSQNMRTSLTLESVSYLFDLSLQQFPIETPKQRLTEIPWLQCLFHQLMHCLLLSPSVSESWNPHPASISVLKHMLHLAVSSKIQLEKSMLESIISDLSGLNNEDRLWPVDWTLVHLCLQIDKDALLPTFSSINDKRASSKVQSNDLLGRLLRRTAATALNEQKLSMPASSLSIHQIVLHDFVIPVAKAFMEARDLKQFLELWEDQLVAWYETTVSSEVSSDYFGNVWEDEELLKLIAMKLEGSLTTGQLIRSIEAAHEILARSSNTNLMVSDARVYAKTTILDCTMDAIRSENTLSKTEQLASPIMDIVAFKIAVPSDQKNPYHWKFWRILATMLENWPRSEHILNLELLQRKIATATQRLVDQLKSFDSSSIRQSAFYGEHLYALRVALSVSLRTTNEEMARSFSESTKLIIRTVIRKMTIAVDNSTKLKIAANEETVLTVEWDGRRESIDSPDTLLLAYVTGIVNSIETLICLDKDLTKDFIDQLYWCAFWGSSTSLNTGAVYPRSFSYAWLWKSLLQANAVIREESWLLGIMCEIQIKNMDLVTKIPTLSTADAQRNFVDSSLSLLPVQSIKRAHRERLATCVQARLFNLYRPSAYKNIHCQITLLTRVAEFPSKLIAMFNDPTFLWSIADKLDIWEFGSSSSIAMSDQTHQCEFLGSFFGLLQGRASICDWRSIECAASSLSRISLHSFWTLEDQNLERMQISRSAMNALRNKDFKWLLGHIGESVFDHVNHDSVYVLFEGLLFYPDLLTSLSTTELVWNVLRRYIDEASQRQPLLLTEQADPLFDGVSNARPEDVLVLAKKLILLEQGRSQSMTALLQSTSVKSLRAQYSRRAILEQLEDSFARLERSTQAEIISVLEQSNKVSPEEDSLSHLRSILKCHCEPDEMTFSMKTALTRVFSTLCESLCRSKTPEICILRMQCLDILLRKKPWVILQWHVDNLLASISTMSSSFGPSLPNRSAGEIFTSLCKLSSSLLTLHRTKLRGRFHMVVRALQGMLRCLFRPFATRLGAGDTLIQPPWLRDNDTALGENHAAAYSRILKTICDPTVSAVTRPRNRIRQELNDETKRARRIAGQHLQYLIIEFCQCQLQGTLVSGARAALNPGLYAIFDAMGQDIIKTVNSALDVQSRPIFKVTYDDYRRFGRWEGS